MGGRSPCTPMVVGICLLFSILGAQSSAGVFSVAPLRGTPPPPLPASPSPLLRAPAALRLRGGADAAVAEAPKEVAATPAIEDPVDPAQEKVLTAVEDLRNKCSDTGRSNEEVVAALKMCVLYTENIAANPTEAKFRRIKTSNKAFAAKIGALPGADEIMLAVGFEAEKEGDETFLTLPEAKASQLTAEIAALKSSIAYGSAVSADTLGQIVTSGTGEEEEPQFEEVYQLSCRMVGHGGDVRGVCCAEGGRLVTASRDKTVRVWGPGEGGGAYKEEACLEGHEYHLASVAVSPPTPERPSGLVFSGQYDLTSHGKIESKPVIKVWEGKECVNTLEGHTATVSALAVSADGSTLFSGSWDKSVRMWDVESGECKGTLEGHEAAVWALLPLPGGKLLTGSADRTIRLWDTVDMKQMGELRGHGDCVRALAMCGSGVFCSAANDCTLKYWSLDLGGNGLDQSVGFCLQTLSGHDSFVYTLAVRDNGDVISGAEDRTVKVWREGKLVSSVRLPDSVWGVAALENGDIAAACADGITYVFTQAEERGAPEEELAAFSALVANRTMELKCALGGLQLEKLPGPEALDRPGTSDGQTRVVRQGDKAFAYGWSASAGKWEPVGEVVDGPQQQIGEKSSLNGKDYDYVFQIEIEEGKTSKIGMNKGDNVYMVASDFIDEHDLNPDYLETIASWLDNEIEKIAPKQEANQECLLDRDPFNEGKVYRAGSAQKLNEEGQVFYDPLTGKKLGGGGSESEEEEEERKKKAAAKPKAPSRHIPTELPYASFPGAPKAEGAMKKLKEINEKAAKPLTEEGMAAVGSLLDSLAAGKGAGEAGGPGVAVLIGPVLSEWPKPDLFPALDALRALMLDGDFATRSAGGAMQGYAVAYSGGAPDADKLREAQGGDLLLRTIMAASYAGGAGGGEEPSALTVLMSMRAVANAFESAPFSPLLQIHTGTVAAVFAEAAKRNAGNKLVQSAFAAVLFNYAKALRGHAADDAVVGTLMDGSLEVLKGYKEDADVAGVYRLVAGLGTLVHGNMTRVKMALDKGLDKQVRMRAMALECVKGGSANPAGDPKTQKCCHQFMDIFDVAQMMAEPGLKHPESDADFDALLAAAGSTPVVVDFFAEWCGPCKHIAPAFEQMALDNPEVIFAKVDVDQLKGTAQKCGVQAMPTFQFFVGGKKVHQIQGANEAGLKAAVETLKAAGGGGAGGGEATPGP